MKNIIRIPLDYYFPWTVMFVALLLLLAGLVLVTLYPFIAVLAVLIALFVFTARYHLTINLTQKTYHDYLWIAGFKKGDKGSFNSIEQLTLKKRNYRQNIGSRVSTMTRHGTEYMAYLQFDTTEVHLLSNDNRKKVLLKLQQISRQLSGNIVSSTSVHINANIVDQTTN